MLANMVGSLLCRERSGGVSAQVDEQARVVVAVRQAKPALAEHGS
jgi:hypothetical protein